MAIGAITIVSLILLSVLVFALASFIAKRRSVAALKLLPGRKPSYLFGNALQLTGEPHGEYYYILVYHRDREVTTSPGFIPIFRSKCRSIHSLPNSTQQFDRRCQNRALNPL